VYGESLEVSLDSNSKLNFLQLFLLLFSVVSTSLQALISLRLTKEIFQPVLNQWIKNPLFCLSNDKTLFWVTVKLKLVFVSRCIALDRFDFLLLTALLLKDKKRVEFVISNVMQGLLLKEMYPF
jgi:hypothetical protein